MSLLLGIDIGTTNWKVAAFDWEGNMISLHKTPTVTAYDAQGRGCYDPKTIWDSVVGLIRQVVEEASQEKMIEAVSVTSMGEAMIPLDVHGEPTYPAVAWFDTRAGVEAARIEKTFGRERLFQITGLDPNPVFSLCKILWLKENEPEAFSKTRMWLSMTDYIYYKLTGQFVTDNTIASRTMAFDLHQNDWSDEILKELGFDRTLFPRVVSSGTVVGEVQSNTAGETGLPCGTPVVAGGHDHLCGSLAAGVLAGRRVLDSSGTAESIIGISDPGAPLPKAFQGLRVGTYLDQSRFALWGGIITSGASLDWAMNNFASLSGWGAGQSQLEYAPLMELVAKTAPGARGLMYMPHLRGSGAPHWNPSSRGVFMGLSTSHTQPELVRAVLEGLCFEVRLILECMESIAGTSFEALHNIGGGSRVSLWQQIKANITGKRVEVPMVGEATVMGAALLAGIGIGIYKDLEDASKKTYRVKEVFIPQMEYMEMYDKDFEIYKKIYPSTIEINALLAKS